MKRPSTTPIWYAEVEAERQREHPGRDHQPAVDLRRSSARDPEGEADDGREHGHPGGDPHAEDQEIPERRAGVLDRGQDEEGDGRRPGEAVDEPHGDRSHELVPAERLREAEPGIGPVAVQMRMAMLVLEGLFVVCVEVLRVGGRASAPAA